MRFIVSLINKLSLERGMLSSEQIQQKHNAAFTVVLAVPLCDLHDGPCFVHARVERGLSVVRFQNDE